MTGEVTLPVLAPALVQRVQEMLQWYDTEKGRLGLRSPPPGAGAQPWHYIVKVPPGGIPAMQEDYNGTGTGSREGDTPGEAECEVYTVWESTPSGANLVKRLMRGSGFYITVLNCSSSAFDPATTPYVSAHRDNEGTWWVGGGGGGSGSCEPDVTALTGVSADGNICDGITLTFNKDTFNCDGTASPQPDVTASIGGTGQVTKTFVTDVDVTGECSGTDIVLNVTLTTDTINGINCPGT